MGCHSAYTQTHSLVWCRWQLSVTGISSHFFFFFSPFYVHHLFFSSAFIFWVQYSLRRHLWFPPVFVLSFFLQVFIFLSIYTFSPFVLVPWPEKKAVKFPPQSFSPDSTLQAGSVEAVTYQNVNRAVFFTLLHRLFLVAEQEQARVCLFKPQL